MDGMDWRIGHWTAALSPKSLLLLLLTLRKALSLLLLLPLLLKGEMMDRSSLAFGRWQMANKRKWGGGGRNFSFAGIITITSEKGTKRGSEYLKRSIHVIDSVAAPDDKRGAPYS